MAKSGPQGSARVLKQTYRYLVADDWVQRRIDDDGIEPSRVWRIEFELRELSDAGARRRARRLAELWKHAPGDVVLPEPTDDPDEFLNNLEAWIDAQGEDAFDLGAESEESRRRRRLAEFDEAMTAWIEDHGSERLKLARARGYKITSTYAKERAALELPECWVDTAGRATHRERVDPSIRALKVESNFRTWIASESLDLDTRIVWLVEPPSSMADYNEPGEEDLFGFEFEQQEALLIPDYLGKYDAFLPVDQDERAPKADAESADGEED